MDTLITDGARLLRAYLKRTGQTVPEFCDAHRLSRQVLQRAFHGSQEKFDVDFALTIEAATERAVPIASWSKATLRPATPDELGRVHPRHRHDTPVPVEPARDSHPAVG